MEQLIFVYNAKRGLLNKLTDYAHKVVSPTTYPCNFCQLTHSNTGMYTEWAQFLADLPIESKFLYKDQLDELRIGIGLSAPAVLLEQNENISTILSAKELNQLQSLPELKSLLGRKLSLLSLIHI